MTKVIVFLSIMLTSFVNIFALDLDLNLVQSNFPVNRIENIIWFNIEGQNSAIVKDLKFKVKFKEL